MKYKLILKKLINFWLGNNQEIKYELKLGENKKLLLNQIMGQKIKIAFTHNIFCFHCGRKTSKSFSQGYCYPCFKKLPQTDICLIKPEQCHFYKGTCRDSQWGEKNCFIKHTVYLADTFEVKVGVTREYQEKTRWMDQGASQAVPLGHTSSRLEAGKVEVFLKESYRDKTVWNKMLFANPQDHDLLVEKKRGLEKIMTGFTTVDFVPVEKNIIYYFRYPVLKLPHDQKSLSLDKTNLIESDLLGIKGQYLLLDSGALNIRKHSGYEIELTIN